MTPELKTTVRLAGIVIEISHRDPWVRRQCEGYLSEDTNTTPDMRVSVSDEAIKAQETALAEKLPFGYTESLCVYRAIAKELPRFDAMVFHAAVVQKNGTAYAFSGKSGVGKSTHSGLWVQHCGAEYVNGDKPIFRLKDGRMYACGTPWAGKKPREQKNVSVPLGALCFLEQAKYNEILPLSPSDMAFSMVGQTILPSDPALVARQLELIDFLVTHTKLYRLRCDISKEAAELSFSTLTGLSSQKQ